MGLDTYIHQMAKMDTSRIWTDEEIDEIYKNDPDYRLIYIKPVKKNEDFHVDGADGYLFKCTMHMFDPRKIRKALGIRVKDGWREDGFCSDAMYTPEKDRPDSEKVYGWFQFVNRHGSRDWNKWEHKEIPALIGDDSLTKLQDWWCIVTVGEELADMRKGANKQFYKDGQWDDNSCPVCSKKVLKEHMMKYFDDKDDEYYGNAREAFKSIIYDKFEDGKGLCVVYA